MSLYNSAGQSSEGKAISIVSVSSINIGIHLSSFVLGSISSGINF